MKINIDDIRKYYGPAALQEKIESALSTIGKPIDEITIDDLAVVDEFHVRGQAATTDLIEAAGLLPGSKILDMGCGLGGSARRLASRLNCRVTGLDLSEEYVSCAKYLTSLLKLEDKVSFKTASCLEMPFDDGEFDGVLSIQMMMNIDDKARLIAEIKRVLKSDGKFVFYEIFEGNGQDLYFPVPWAQEPTHNALCSPSELRTLLSDTGFEVVAWEDKTEISKKAFEGMSPPSNNAKLPPIGVHFLVGDDILTKAYNVKRNFDEGRISLIQAVAVNKVA